MARQLRPLYSGAMEIVRKPAVSELAAVLETALDAVVLMSEDGYVVGWNGVAETAFGWSAEEAIGRRMAELIIPQRYRDAHETGLKRYLKTGRGPVLDRHIEISAVHRDGRELPIELSITPTRDGGRRVFLGFLRDITDRTNVRRLLERRAAEAEATSRLTALAAETSSFENVMRTCLAEVCTITGWRLGHALRVDGSDAERLHSTGIWHHVGDIDFAALRGASEQIASFGPDTLPGRAAAQRTAVWLRDVGDNPNFRRAEVAGALGLQSALAFPVFSENRTIAVLEFFSHAVAEPDSTLLPVLSTMGEQIGRVFERSAAEERLRTERDALAREVTERKRAERHQQLLLAELNHRVKNMLAVVLGIAEHTVKHSASLEAFAESYIGRVTSLSKAHTLLAAQSWEAASLRSLTEDMLGAYATGPAPRLALHGEDAELPARAALALAMILHELLTNAAQYGALAGLEGRVSVSWQVADTDAGRRVRLDWRETGAECVRPPAAAGFGTRMIDANASRELQGTASRTWHSEGLQFALDFPILDAAD